MDFINLPKELNNIISKYTHQLLMKDICEELHNTIKTNTKICSHCNEKKFHVCWSSCFECGDENICTSCSNKYTKKFEDIDVPICHFCSC